MVVVVLCMLSYGALVVKTSDIVMDEKAQASQSQLDVECLECMCSMLIARVLCSKGMYDFGCWWPWLA